jgi:hypothetical protein
VSLRLSDRIHTSDANPAIFFRQRHRVAAPPDDARV